MDNRVESDEYGAAKQEQLESIQLEKMREDIQAGLDALKAGKFTEYDSAEDLINDVRAEGKGRQARK